MSIANFNLYEILFQKTDWVYRYEKDSKNELALKNFCNFCNFYNQKTKMFILWCFFSVAEKNKNKRSATETTKYNICRLIHIVFLSCRSWTSCRKKCVRKIFCNQLFLRYFYTFCILLQKLQKLQKYFMENFLQPEKLQNGYKKTANYEN